MKCVYAKNRFNKITVWYFGFIRWKHTTWMSEILINCSKSGKTHMNVFAFMQHNNKKQVHNHNMKLLNMQFDIFINWPPSVFKLQNIMTENKDKHQWKKNPSPGKELEKQFQWLITCMHISTFMSFLLASFWKCSASTILKLKYGTIVPVMLYTVGNGNPIIWLDDD